MVMVTAAYRRVYDSRHLQADCQKNRDQLRNPTLGNRVVYGLRFLLSHNTTTGRTDNGSMEHGVSGSQLAGKFLARCEQLFSFLCVQKLGGRRFSNSPSPTCPDLRPYIARRRAAAAVSTPVVAMDCRCSDAAAAAASAVSASFRHRDTAKRH